MDARAELAARIDGQRADALALVSDLVKHPSENPPGDVREVSASLAGWLRERGLPPRVVETRPEDGLVNLLVEVEGAGPGRHVVFNGHTDTFPVGDRSLWTRDPFSGLVADGRIHGRGVADMKGGLAASVVAFVLLAGMREAWRGRLTLAVVCDEETMGPWGAAWLVDRDPRLRGDAVIIGEPSSPRTIRFGERGFVWVRVTTRGLSSHAAYPHHGWNAIAAMTEVLQEIRALEARPWPVPAEFLGAIDAARATTDELLGAGATDVLSSVNVNLGTIRGGTKINLTADACEAEVDIRLPPGVTGAAALQHVGRVVRSHRGATYEVLRRSEPNYSAPDHELFRVMTAVVTEVRGTPPGLTIGAPATDSRVFRRAGMPVAVFGPRPYNLGAADESITVEDYLDTIRVHALTALDFLARA
jgi:acetylornithine deacetylase/succinyl-diaminopimelate desuccinylase family protein